MKVHIFQSNTPHLTFVLLTCICSLVILSEGNRCQLGSATYNKFGLPPSRNSIGCYDTLYLLHEMAAGTLQVAHLSALKLCSIMAEAAPNVAVSVGETVDSN